MGNMPDKSDPAASVAECCAQCIADKACAKWAWHAETLPRMCHKHGANGVVDTRQGCFAGVMNRSATSRTPFKSDDRHVGRSWLLIGAMLLHVRADPEPGALDALSFGAIPDDGKDDTVALRYLLGNCSKGNGQVYIPAGHYIVSMLTTKQGGPLPAPTVDILPVPSNCHVLGAGHSPEMPKVTTIAMSTTGGADGKGVNGVDGCWWRMFGWCGNSSRCSGANTPSNVSAKLSWLASHQQSRSKRSCATDHDHGHAPERLDELHQLRPDRWHARARLPHLLRACSRGSPLCSVACLLLNPRPLLR